MGTVWMIDGREKSAFLFRSSHIDAFARQPCRYRRVESRRRLQCNARKLIGRAHVRDATDIPIIIGSRHHACAGRRPQLYQS
jgi:hypothetical protein